MKKIDLYILREFLTTFVIVSIFFTLISLIVDVFENLNRFIDNEVSANILIDYYKDLAENERDYVGEGYKYSFTKNWGISLENFYKEFDEFMLKSRAEQISFLNLN